MKKFILSFLFINSLLFVNAYDFYNKNLYYNINTDGKTVTVFGDNIEGDVIIPKTITKGNKTYIVTKIGDYAFIDCKGVKTITIPNSVIIIGERAFSSLKQLEKVVIPNSVVEIGDEAFSYSGIKSINIPSSVKKIGILAFRDCVRLESVIVENCYYPINEYVFQGCILLNDNIFYVDNESNTIDEERGDIDIFQPTSNDDIDDYIVVPMQEEQKPTKDDVFFSATHMPSFPGGNYALIQFINSNIRYPKVASKKNIQGVVVVQFVVTKSGEIGDIKVVRSVDKDLDKEAVRVCKMLPNFYPARNAVGDPVNVWYTMPIRFRFR